MKFLVTAQMYPGVYRQGVGFFRPGASVELGKNEIPSKSYEPMDAEAQAALEKHHKIKKEIVGLPGEVKKDEKLTVKQAVGNS